MSKAKTPKLKFFDNVEDVLTYITGELVSTLRDDLDRMEGDERKHYSNEDRKDMKAKIHDIGKMEALIMNAPKVLTALSDLLDDIEGLERDFDICREISRESTAAKEARIFIKASA